VSPDPLTPDELPADVADAAAERLLGVSGAQREDVLGGLIAAHPQHAAGLRRFADDLAGADAMLGATFARVRRDDPEQIGGHRVVQKLGEGAFGVVYRCAQERPVVRDVAIKVLRPGAGDERTLRRFAAERQALATLSHPSITQVFDAGELPDGRPFFVMEHVPGATIRAYCEARDLSCAERLRLFVQVCRGVAHAHARGIVHRDLKPANVLVVDGGDGPLPKIIDFGIAKALFATAGGDTPRPDLPRTDAGRVVGTPGYMSPEQAAGRVDDVDARADVFALGVMLYELLTGALPWTDGAAATDTDPLRPSARVTTSTQRAAPSAVAQRRQLAATLRGDLDWITLKALARERDDRYASVADLVADIERHLRGETVSVGPPSLRYRLRKFVRRNRAPVTMGLSALVVVTGLAVAFAYGSSKEAEAADARSAVAASQADARGVVTRLLRRANEPALFGTAQGDDVRRVLSAEALHFAEQLRASDPADLQLQGNSCEALQSVAEVHWLLGEPTQARAVATEAVRIGERLFAAEPANLRWRGLLAGSLRQLGRAIALAGNDAEAHPPLATAVEHLAVCAAADPAHYTSTYAAALREAAHTLPGQQRAQAVEMYRRAKDLYASMRVEPGRETEVRDNCFAAGIDLARALVDARKMEAAKEQLEQIAPLMAGAEPRPLRAQSEFHKLLGAVRWNLGERASTLPDFEAAAAAAEAWCRAQPRRNLAHRLRALRQADLGFTHNYLGNFDESSAAFRRSIDAAESLAQQFPDDSASFSFLCSNLCRFAYVLRDRFRLRDLAEAAACIERAIEVETRIPASVVTDRPPRWQLLATLAAIEESRGAEDAARRWAAVADNLPAWETIGDDVGLNLYLEAVLGIARMRLAAGDPAAVEAGLAAARECVEAHPDHNKLMVEVERLQARLAAANGDHAAAAAAAQRILDLRNTWLTRLRAADCMLLAWRVARAREDADPDAVDGYRDNAGLSYRMVVKTLDPDIARDPPDPWYVLPWGFAKLHLAELEAADGNTGAAKSFLAEALPRLEAVRGDAQGDQWDEPAFRAGVELQQRLRGANR